MRGAKIQEKKNNFCSLQRVFYFAQSYGGTKHERCGDGEAARGEKRFSISISNKVFTVLKNLEMHRALV